MQEQEADFTKIKPYEEEQVHDTLVRILSNPDFQKIIDYLYPKEIQGKLREDLLEVTTSLEFQMLFIDRKSVV